MTDYAERPFTDMNHYSRYLRDLDETPLTDDEAYALQKKGDTEALFQSVAVLVPYIIQKYVADCFSRENYGDMVQEGNIAILKAIDSWKPHKGSSLATWCYMYVRQSIFRNMKRELRFEHTHMSYDFDEDDSDYRTDWIRTHTDDIVDHSDDGEWQEAQDSILHYNAIRARQTTRDRIILDLLKDGRTQSYIADALQLSQSRVSRLVKDLFGRIQQSEA